MRTTLTATGEHAVPVSFGFHPYLRLPGVARGDWGAVGDAIEPGSDNVRRVQRAGIEAMTAVARTKLELLANR